MRADLKTGAIALVLLISFASCDSNKYNDELMSGPSDTLFTPTKSNAPLLDTIAPISTDTTGRETGRMSDTKMTH